MKYYFGLTAYDMCQRVFLVDNIIGYQPIYGRIFLLHPVYFLFRSAMLVYFSRLFQKMDF